MRASASTMGPGRRLLKVLMMLHVPSSLLMAMLVAVPMWKAGLSPVVAAVRGLPMFLGMMGCFAVNDYCDRVKDAIDKPYRAIPSGAIGPRAALALGVTLSVASVCAAFAVSSSLRELGCDLAVVVGSVAYSPLLRLIGPAKGVYTALVVSVPFAYALACVDLRVDAALFYVAVVFYVAGKELLGDMRDAKGDAMGGLRTIPGLLGGEASAALVCASQVAFIALLAASGLRAPLLIAAAAIIVTIDGFVSVGSRQSWRAAMYLTWLPLVVCILPPVLAA